MLEPLAARTLAETLDGGQCFRWNRSGDRSWNGVCGSLAARLESGAEDAAVRAGILAGDRASLAHHLAEDVDWRALADQLPWRCDAHLARCIEAFPGLRILRQPLGEALLCFLCSATKQVVQIKQMTEALAARFGRELAPGIHALPTWPKLAEATEEELRGCLLGFRARYIGRTARLLAARPGWLEETATMPYASARERLLELPGVGAKIADCALLFGAGKLEAFPVDVWLLRAMARHYGLDGWSPGQIAHFGRVHFGPLAGLAQQYLFAWERQYSRRQATVA